MLSDTWILSYGHKVCLYVKSKPLLLVSPVSSAFVTTPNMKGVNEANENMIAKINHQFALRILHLLGTVGKLAPQNLSADAPVAVLVTALGMIT